MRQDVHALREFYATPLGEAARRMIGRKVGEAWNEGTDLDVLGCGYPTPLLAAVEARARRTVAVMSAAQGAEVWPGGRANRVCLAEDGAYPFANALFDRILAAHALEEAESPLAVLRELHRVLAPSGRIIVVVAARHGLWANAETTPFGHGRPFSRRQLETLMREAEFEPLGWTRALYLPPLAMAARWSEGFEQAGARLWPRFGGLILMEAVKRTFAPATVGQRVRARPRPAFQAAPVAGNIAASASLGRERTAGRRMR